MNIFVLSECPIQSAYDLCNRHSSRMPLETAGMLAFAFPEGATPVDNSYSHSHYRHPASVWARSSLENLEWLILHGLAQCEEYTRRYKRRHASQDFIEWVENNYKSLFLSGPQSPFARCLSGYKEELDKTEPDAVQAYQKFYWLDKKDFAKWPTLKAIPEWWPEKSEKYVDKSFKDGIYTKR
jgi:hypothetical protein